MYFRYATKVCLFLLISKYISKFFMKNFNFGYNYPKSVISVMMITFLFLNRCFYVLRAQWRSIVTDKRRDR